MACNSDDGAVSSRLSAALKLHERGLPITLCRGKQPLRAGWQSRTFTAEKIVKSFRSDPSLNVGLVLGQRSGIIDLEGDAEQSEADFEQLFAGCEIPTTPTYVTKRGRHRLFCWDERLEALGKAKLMYATVEVRLGAGKAAQSLLPPSVTDGFTRQWETSLDDCDPAKLPDEVIARIIEATKKPNRATQPNPPFLASVPTATTQDRPGDDFNRRTPWHEILLPHGWTLCGESGGVTHWRRPGKTDDGISATTGFCESPQGKDLFYCFSSNAPPFEQDRAYDKFAVYTLLNHVGDFQSAARELAEKGYGTPRATGEKNDKKSAATVIVEIASQAELFHSERREPFATIPIKSHTETWATDTRAFREWLEYKYYAATGKVPSAQAVKDAVGVLSAKARFEGQEQRVCTRIGVFGDAIYIDLVNDAWEAIEVTSEGWDVVQRPPVRFRRSKGMLPLPRPQHGGCIDELRRFVNVRDDQWTLFVGALLGAYRPRGPYPVTILQGEQGSAKSTTARLCRELIDPNVAPLRSEPREIRDLMIAANNGWLVAFDNLSKVPPWLSDSLCRLSTGGGFGCRELYENQEEVLFDAQRPTLLTGIEELAVREDLLDRALIIDLPAIPEDRRRPEATFWEEFDRVKPLILGSLLSGVAGTLRDHSSTTLPKLPRMADFALWVTAAEASLSWPKGSFMASYARNRAAANEAALDSPVADAVRKVAADGDWEGRPSDLLSLLENHVDDSTKAQKEWPRNAAALSGKLKRLAPNLRRIGIEVEWSKTSNTNSRRVIAVRKV